MVICRQWNMKIVTNLGNCVSGKVLTHQSHDNDVVLASRIRNGAAPEIMTMIYMRSF